MAGAIGRKSVGKVMAGGSSDECREHECVNARGEFRDKCVAEPLEGRIERTRRPWKIR